MRNVCLMLVLMCIWSSCTEQEVHEVVVIGGGLMGSATSWHLAQAGLPVVLLEKQDSLYTTGSSYGDTRITQKHSLLTDDEAFLHTRALKETAGLIAYLNERYEVARPYIMEHIYTTAIVTNIHPRNQKDAIVPILERQEVDFKIADSPASADEQFKMDIPDSLLVLREYGLYTGTLNPMSLINHLHLAIDGMGSEVRYRSKVTGLTKQDDVFRIEVEHVASGEVEVMLARNVVAAAGPYTGSLLASLNPAISDLIQPQRVAEAFLKLNDERFASLTVPEQVRYAMGFPLVNSFPNEKAQPYQATVEYFEDNGNPLLKVGSQERSQVSNLDMVWGLNLSAQEQGDAVDNLLDYTRLLGMSLTADDIEYVDGRSSVYSMTKTAVPYVSKVPDTNGDEIDGLVMLAGMSGTGARAAMVYGLIAANLVLGRQDEEVCFNYLMEKFRFDRLPNDRGTVCVM
ncbi:MAG: FAD-dependent oxidoreductase [Bacteroidota bacterium]